ncbi:PP2C family protein-serine/threonine phosphatase [Massilia sp. PWRC2]|uniref:PP2C family protein-serine/threonine phosphatase n=1 Tax=Massilia sp. PWRC2 TaxID=2804626 RepID=UPI003CF80E05
MPALPPLDFGQHFDIAAASRASADPATPLENQDNFLLIDATGRARFLHGQQLQDTQLANWPAGHLRVAVLDGMGGHGHGREAAEAVVAGLLALPAWSTLAEVCADLDALHTRLQADFASQAGAVRPPSRRPGTTLTLLEIAPGQAPMLYHVGDSRLYELGHDSISVLTVDHVPATAFAMAGVLQAAEWWQQVHGEHRPQIAQAFVLGNAFADPSTLADGLYPLSSERLPPFLRHLPDRRALTLRAHASYLLATDGFWSCAAPQAWVNSWPALLGETDANAMVERLFSALGHHPPDNLHLDNLTAIVIRPLSAASNSGNHNDDHTYASMEKN